VGQIINAINNISIISHKLQMQKANKNKPGADNKDE
jgi:hypothetical protein